jgi:hypothetical protein
MDCKIGGLIPNMDTYIVSYIVQTSVAAHQTSYPVSRAPFLPGWLGTAKCEGDLKSNYHQTKESVEPCHHSLMHVYSVILGVRHRNDFNFESQLKPLTVF